MKEKQSRQGSEIGMVGLGVMGRNLVLNIADQDFSVAGYDKDQAKVEVLRKEAAERKVCGAANIVDFIALLRKPRAWLPANLIHAQRDYFGAHTYERGDAKGTFHTKWEAK
jgi:6-phosphogluconate dehydrogenase